jgi:hypothetical protein
LACQLCWSNSILHRRIRPDTLSRKDTSSFGATTQSGCETGNGEHRELKFPTPLYVLFSGKRSFLGLSSEQEARLSGCDAEIYGADIQYLWPTSFRVWKVDCGTAPVSCEQIAAKYRSMDSDYASAPWFGAVIMGALFVGVFIQTGKKK